MNKWCLPGVLLLTTVAYSTTAFAARHHYDVIGESYGRSSEEAIDNAWRDADTQCYRNWGMSDQDITVLEVWVNEAGYPAARVSLGCTIDD